MTRRDFLRALGSVGTGFCAVGYMHIEPRLLRLNKRVLPLLDPGSRPLRIAHLSDLHAFEPTPLHILDQACDLTASAKPDLICLTGDYITHRLQDRFALLRVLRKLSACAPTYACLGNHDGGDWARRFGGGYATTEEMRLLLQQSGICSLHNTSVTTSAGEGRLKLAGIGDPWSGEMRPEQAFAAEPDTERLPTLLLCHNPDAKDELRAYPWDLMLCGHTHGGQIVLPFIGAPCLPIGDRTYAAGLHGWGRRWVHTTTGIGSMLGLRLNCRPEVAILELTPVSGAASI